MALIGRAPSEAPIETFRLAELKLPTNLPVSLPAALIEQRPDVRLAEEQLHSASALVGVATANMLPSLTVTAGAGYTATSLASLMTGPNLFWNVAGSASLRAIQNDADTLKAANEFEKAAKISLTLSQQQMQTGQANVLFLLDAQITYEQALIQVVQAQAATRWRCLQRWAVAGRTA